LPPVHAAGAEEPARVGYSSREIAEGLREAVRGKNNMRRLVVEIEELLEAGAKMASVPIALATKYPRAAIVAAVLLRTRTRKRRR
jgi:hypothetical protein